MQSITLTLDLIRQGCIFSPLKVRENKPDLGEKNLTWAKKLELGLWLCSVKKIPRPINVTNKCSYQHCVEKLSKTPLHLRTDILPSFTGRGQK